MSVGALFRRFAVLEQASELVTPQRFEGRVREAEGELAKGVRGRINVAERAIGVAEMQKVVRIIGRMSDGDLAVLGEKIQSEWTNSASARRGVQTHCQ